MTEPQESKPYIPGLNAEALRPKLVSERALRSTIRRPQIGLGNPWKFRELIWVGPLARL